MVDWEILEEIKKGNLKVTPFDESLINPNSLDIRLGYHFSIVTYDFKWDKGTATSGYPYINPLDPSTFKTVASEGRSIIVPPKSFVLASLMEDISLPDYICGEVRGKSSLGRLGLDNSSCAGWLDAGFQGVITIELFNHADYGIKLSSEMKIGQIIFNKTETADKPYNIKGRYQNQKAGQGSLGV